MLGSVSSRGSSVPHTGHAYYTAEKHSVRADDLGVVGFALRVLIYLFANDVSGSAFLFRLHDMRSI